MYLVLFWLKTGTGAIQLTVANSMSSEHSPGITEVVLACIVFTYCITLYSDIFQNSNKCNCLKKFRVLAVGFLLLIRQGTLEQNLLKEIKFTKCLVEFGDILTDFNCTGFQC